MTTATYISSVPVCSGIINVGTCNFGAAGDVIVVDVVDAVDVADLSALGDMSNRDRILAACIRDDDEGRVGEGGV